MAKRDKLYELIHSLNKSEKRFFKLYSQLTGEAREKNYLKLFDAYLSVKKYKAENLENALHNHGLDEIAHKGSDKNYLYHQILESLRIQHQKNSAKSKARFHLDICNILFRKGLVDQALQECIKAKKIVDKFHLTSLMPDILLAERILISYKGIDIEQLNVSKEELMNNLRQIESFNNADYFYRLAVNDVLKQGKNRSEKEKTNASSLLDTIQSISDNSNPHTLIRKYQGKAVIHFTNNEHEKEYAAINRIIEIMDSHPDFKQENFFEYITFLSHALRLSKNVAPGSYDEKLTAFLQLAQTAKQDKRKVEARIYSLGHSTNTVKLLEEGEYQKGIELIPSIQAILKKHGELTPRSIHITFEYKFAYFHFGVGELTTALKYINKILNEYHEDDRKDVYSFARIFNLIIHYELGNYSLISYYLRSVYQFLKKRELLHPFEYMILQTLKSLPKAKNKIEKEDILIQKKRELIKFFKETPEELHVLEFFDFLTWIDSKLEKKPFAAIKKERRTPFQT